MTLRQAYCQAIARSEYYRWQAMNNQPIAGNDPVTGRKRSHYCFVTRGEGRAAYKAMARYWLNEARSLRISA